jgi:allophanate hydrolase subunit 2
MRVALTGAECNANLDGVPVWSWHAFDVRRGETLTLPSRAAARAPISAWPVASTCPWS